MTAANARPKLASKVRLRVDRHTGQTMLLFPEKGMALNSTAAAVAELCTGAHDLTAIVATLAARFPGTSPDVIEREARAFLDALRERGLLEVSE